MPNFSKQPTVQTKKYVYDIKYVYICIKDINLSVNLLIVTDIIFQQYIDLCNKCISVPLTDTHLQRTCSEIVYVQHQSCNHILSHSRMRKFFTEME